MDRHFRHKMIFNGPIDRLDLSQSELLTQSVKFVKGFVLSVDHNGYDRI